MAAMCCDARARDLAAWSPATETLRLFQAVGAQKTTHTRSRLPAFSTSSIQLTARLHFISESIHHTAALTPP